MQNTELKTLVDSNLNFVKDYYQTNDSFCPMLIINGLTPDLKKVNMVVMITDLKTRYELIKMLALKIVSLVKTQKVKNVDSIFMMSEAWMSIAKTKNGSEKDEKLKQGLMRQSEDPDKVEVLISAGQSEVGETQMNMYQINKTWLDGIISVDFTNMDTLLSKIDGEKSEDKADSLKSFAPILDELWGLYHKFSDIYDKMPEEIKKMTDELGTDFKTNI